MCIAFLISFSATPVTHGFAQESAATPGEEAVVITEEPADDTSIAPGPEETPVIDAEPADTPADGPAPTAEQTEPDSAPGEVIDPAPPTPTPEPPLSFNQSLACTTADDTVVQGGWTDLSCVLATSPVVEGGASEVTYQIAVDQLGPGWSANARLPDNETWHDLSDAAEPFTVTQGIAPESSGGFSLIIRLYAPCQATADDGRTPSVVLTPRFDPDVAVADETRAPVRAPIELAVRAASTPAVVPIAFTADPVTFMPTEQIVHGVLTVRVETSDPQCGSWNVLLSGSALIAADGAPISSPDLRLTSAAGSASSGSLFEYLDIALIPDGGLLLEEPQVVALLFAGAEPGISLITIGIDLTIPGQTSVGSYSSQLGVDVSAAS